MIVGLWGDRPDRAAGWFASVGVTVGVTAGAAIGAPRADASMGPAGLIRLGHGGGECDSRFDDDTLSVVAESRLALSAGLTGANAIAQAYRRNGIACVRTLGGWFSFILHDAARRQTFAASSLTPNTPLAYCSIGGMTLVSSRVGAILRHPAAPRALDDLYLAHVLTGFAAMPAGSTAIGGIRRLCAGELLVLSALGASVIRVDRLEPRVFGTRSRPALVRAFWEELGRATDRALGAYPHACLSLSGGLDSAAVASALVASGRTVDAYSFVATDLDAAAEEPSLRALSQTWSTVRLTRVDVSTGIDFPDTGGAELRDDPLLLPLSLLPARMHLWSAARAAGFRTIIEGEGGDELFSTLPTMLDALRRRDGATLVRQFWFRKGRRALGQWGLVLPTLPGFIRREWIRRFAGDVAPLPTFLTQDAAAMECVRTATAQFVSGLVHQSFRDRAQEWLSAPATVAATLSRHDFAARCGVVLAWPLMDRGVVEFALGLPPAELLSHAGEDKAFLRAALIGRIPEPVRRRTKDIGLYYAFVARVLGSPRARHAIAHERVRQRLARWIHFDRLESLLDAARRGRVTSLSVLWQLESVVSFADWYARAATEWGIP